MLNVVNKPIQALLIMLCVAALPAAAQERTAPALPPDGQQAFDRGLMAVQLQEWDLAIRYFTAASYTGPVVPTVLFNLGLAHARAGHELPAIAWLHAYLAVTPQAPNAEAIRAEIERLKTVMRGKMNAIFQTAITAAQQLDPNGPFLQDKDTALFGIADSQARAGDVEGAIATSKLRGYQEETPKVSSRWWSVFSKELMWNGDLERAQEAMKNVTAAEDQDGVWDTRCNKMYMSGDLEAARNAAQKIHDADKRGRWLQVLRIKDAEGKSQTINREGAAKEYVDDWCGLAYGFSTDECTCNVENALKDAAEAKGDRWRIHGETATNRIENLAEVAESLGIALNKISVLERKSGQERGGK